jgi:hypothetical protein
MANGATITQFGLRLKDGIKPLTGITAESVHIREAANEASVWSFIISASQFSAFNESYRDFMLGETPRVNVRLGMNNGGATTWQPWQEHIVTRLKSVPKVDANTILMQTADRFAEVDRSTRTAAWQGKVSDIARRIAGLMDLEPVVEDTEGDYSLIQSFCSDYDFLIRLASRAVNKAGSANYRVFVKDRELHFHTIAFKAREPIQLEGFFAPSTSVVISDDTQLQVHAGSAGSKLYTFNPFNGEVSIVKSTEAKQKLAKAGPPVHKISGGSLNLGFTIGQNRTEANDIAQASYESARHGNYVVSLRTEGRVVHVDDKISLDISQSTAQPSPWSGFYVVSSAVHDIQQGAVHSKVVATRGDIN